LNAAQPTRELTNSCFSNDVIKNLKYVLLICVRNVRFQSQEKVPGHCDVWLLSYEGWFCVTQFGHDDRSSDKNQNKVNLGNG